MATCILKKFKPFKMPTMFQTARTNNEYCSLLPPSSPSHHADRSQRTKNVYFCTVCDQNLWSVVITGRHDSRTADLQVCNGRLLRFDHECRVSVAWCALSDAQRHMKEKQRYQAGKKKPTNQTTVMHVVIAMMTAHGGFTHVHGKMMSHALFEPDQRHVAQRVQLAVPRKFVSSSSRFFPCCFVCHIGWHPMHSTFLK